MSLLLATKSLLSSFHFLQLAGKAKIIYQDVCSKAGLYLFIGLVIIYLRLFFLGLNSSLQTGIEK